MKKKLLIPETTGFKENKKVGLRQKIKEFYKEKIQGKSVINKDIGVEIRFTSEGIGKIASNRNIGVINASATKVIDKMLANAEYSNFGQRKPTDKKNVIGYLNFKGKAKIDKKLYHFRIAVKLKTDMKAYYNHTVNRFKGWDK